MGELEIKTTKVFSRNYEALMDNDIRFVVNQGGSRSSKTYSLCQLLMVYCLQTPNKVVSIVRKSFPSLRATIYRDMMEILKENDLYSDKRHNKTEHIFTFPNGTQLEFFSMDDSQKVRGRKRDILVCNEANELEYEEFVQLNMRTTSKLFFDFNPSDTEHWLYQLIDNPKSKLIHSTYKDNPFLGKDIINEIEQLILTDQDYYNIYALGLPSKSNFTIYNHQQFYTEKEEGTKLILGLDFGFIDPTALIAVNFRENKIWSEELLYESYLTTPELIDKLTKIFEENNISKSTTIVVDYARPEIKEELNRNGFNCVNAIKNIREGIDAVKSKIFYVHHDSVNLKKELKNYKWKLRGEKPLDEPQDKHNHLLDALRYAVLWYKKNDYNEAGGYSFDSFSF